MYYMVNYFWILTNHIYEDSFFDMHQLLIIQENQNLGKKTI